VATPGVVELGGVVGVVGAGLLAPPLCAAAGEAIAQAATAAISAAVLRSLSGCRNRSSFVSLRG
jgi:hypothetical protein